MSKRRRHYDDPPLLKRSVSNLSKKQSLTILIFIAIAIIVVGLISIQVGLRQLRMPEAFALDTSNMICSDVGGIASICIEKDDNCKAYPEDSGLTIICSYGSDTSDLEPTHIKPDV